MYYNFMVDCQALAIASEMLKRLTAPVRFITQLAQKILRPLPLIISISLCGLPMASADTDKQQKVLQQKLALLNNMLTRGSTVKKIKDSANSEALSLLKQAEDLYKIANDSINEGNSENVSDVINDAIRKISAAAAKAKGQSGSTAAERSRYQELLGNINSLRTSAENDFTTNIDLDPVDKLKQEARALTDKDDYTQALKKLNSAYQYIVTQMADNVSVTTVVYRLDFKTPKDEYEYELRRYNDNRELVSRMLFEHEKNPTRMLIERYTEQADKTLELAMNHASEDKHDDALQTIEKANKELKRSMGMLGLNF
jgi:tetratricopeptide (TPR) repeat protein